MGVCLSYLIGSVWMSIRGLCRWVFFVGVEGLSYGGVRLLSGWGFCWWVLFLSGAGEVVWYREGVSIESGLDFGVVFVVWVIWDK